jgi:hypothetical protein
MLENSHERGGPIDRAADEGTRATRRLIVIAQAVTNPSGEVREWLNRAVSKTEVCGKRRNLLEPSKTLRDNEIK